MSESPGMPALDPARYRRHRLADPGHTLPVPGSARLFAQDAEGEMVDLHDPYWMMLVADGSLVPVEPAETAPSAAG